MESLEPTQKILARRLRARRKTLGLSQEQLALDASVNRTFVSQIERGIGNPSLHTLCRLADRLGLPCHALLSDEWDWSDESKCKEPALSTFSPKSSMMRV
jgi:transcriptional regulator with XRE-family HTH domain